MRLFSVAAVVFIVLGIFSTTVWASKQVSPANKFVSPKVAAPKIDKYTTPAKPAPFRVKSVQFHTISVNNQSHLVAAVVFNNNIDASTVQQNLNIRLLKKNESHNWVDLSTQNNTVQIRPNFITWVSGAPLENGYYVMHLRGTIKSSDGLFLDCNGDGVGEGGALPPYESKIHQVSGIRILNETDLDRLENILGQ